MSAAVTTPSRTSLILAFAAIYLIWGSTYLGIRIAVETMPPFLMAGVRFVLAGAVLFTFVKSRGADWPTWAQIRDNTIIGIFLLLGGNGLVVYAEQFIPSGITALIIGVSPLFMVLTEWGWPGGSRPTGPTITGLLLGFAGVTWLAAPWEQTGPGALPIGAVFAILAGCASWSLGSIFSRRARQPAPPFMASSLQMLGGGCALLLTAWPHGDFQRFNLHAVSPHSWWAFGYLVIVGSLVAYSTFVWLIKVSTPARVSTYAYVNPVVAVFLGWLIADEPVTTRTIAAAGIIVASVVIIVTQKNRPQRA